MKRLEDNIFPEIGDYPIEEISPPTLLQVIRKIERRPALRSLVFTHKVRCSGDVQAIEI